jgi:sugar-specific transcriptional regulator TrmB
MTTMNAEELIELGFNKNEAKVYLSLIKFRESDAHRIIQDTKFHKNIVYDNLDKLIEKGLVTYILKEGKKIFKIASPNMLIELFNEKEKEIQEKKEKAKKIAEEINKLSKQVRYKQEANIYRGIKGIKSFYKETLEGKDYVVFGAPKRSLETMGETFWKNYNLKRIEKKIKVRMIFNPSIKSYGKTIVNKLTLVKYFDNDFEPLTETHIQEDKVGIIVWTEEPILFLIRDKNVANSYLKFFENMWKIAKR